MSTLQRILSVVFLAVGLALAGVGVYMATTPAIPEAYVATAEAKITGIYSDSHTNASGKWVEDHNVVVGYAVDGVEYERPLGYYNSAMYVGDTVGIQYDTRNPGKIVSPAGRTIATVVLIVLGAAFTVFGVIAMVRPLTIRVRLYGSIR